MVTRAGHTEHAEGGPTAALSAQHCGRMGRAGRKTVSADTEGSVTDSALVLVRTAKEINNL